MFSGIVEELGEVKRISQRQNLILFEVGAQKTCEDIKIGDSVAVNGACLTVISRTQDELGFQVMPQTLANTTLQFLRVGEKVNLERSLKIGDRLSGHFVTGHIDCVGIIRNRYYKENNLCFEITVPQEHMRYVVQKGSIAIDGISLTVVERRGNVLRVYIIPHTLKNTTFSFKGPSDKVNMEFDILIKGIRPDEAT